MTDAPKRIRIDPDYNGWDSQVIGWDSDRRDDQGRHFAESDWPEYLRADLIDMDVLRRVEAALKDSFSISRAQGIIANKALVHLQAMMEKLK